MLAWLRTSFPRGRRPSPRRRKVVLEIFEARRLLAAEWLNLVIAEDVDNSGFVTVADLLPVLEDLRTNGIPHNLTVQPAIGPPPYVDVNGDDHVTISDVLAIVTPLRSGLDLPLPTVTAFLADDTGEPDDGVTSNATISGQITAGLTAATRLTARTGSGANVPLGLDSAGRFSFDPSDLGAGLSLGEHTVRLFAQNLGGHVGQAEVRLTYAWADEPDVALVWSQMALEAIRIDASSPPIASRALAMTSLAVLDALAALEGTPAYGVAATAPATTSRIAAVAGAAHGVLSYLFPAQQPALDARLAESLSHVVEGPGADQGAALGRAVGESIIALRAGDGWDKFIDHASSNSLGQWRPTTPMFDVALLPQWAELEPFAMTAPDQFRPAGPPALSSLEYADALHEVQQLGQATGGSRTAEQTQIARFWADGPGTVTPVGHWNQIAASVALKRRNGLSANARLLGELNLALADAAIVAWDAKYAANFWRPVTAIREADLDDNPDTASDAAWSPLLITPPFPEYVSGHSTFSAAAAEVLTHAFGEDTAFTVNSPGLPGVERSFTSFRQAAEEAGRSRIYGGIHFEFANQDGQAAGRSVAQWVLDRFSSETDVQPPRVLITSPAAGHVASSNFNLEGHVLDNLSGAARLEVQLDEDAFADLPFDAQGNFTYPTAFALDGSADGSHVLRLRAIDAAGNVSPARELPFLLDTQAPRITLDSPAGDGQLHVNTQIAGLADATGSALTRLTYEFETGPVFPLAFDRPTGEFSQPLDLSRLAAGPHTLTITARDAAGLEASTNLAVNLTSAVPFTVASFTPLDGAEDVGSTFRPQVVFSRPVDPASLNADNFFATGPNGAKLPANIVPAADGRFAWLFFADPMPGGSRIALHVDGSTILAGDGSLLDADADGVPGGALEVFFTTVSLTPLVGTTLSGKVVDPGPDLKPMTFDDIRAGVDQILHTPDDVFLLPLAGVKVFIVGLEDQVVITDAAGKFRFDTAPAGNVKLAIDGRTATGAPAGFYFPEMVMDLNLEAGRANTVMGTMGTAEERAANRDRQEAYLPRLPTSILQNVNAAVPTTIGAAAAATPNLTAEERALLTIEVQPGTLFDEQGNPVTGGQVGISTVPPELVREMLPPGVLQHTFDITVQAPGVTAFSAPAPMTFPNIFNAPPGSQSNFLSFDHTTGRLVIEGTATVSADGLSVRTDPGTGITHPGWHGLTPPGGPGGPEKPEVCPAPPNASPGAEGELGNALELDRIFVTSNAGRVEDFLLTSNEERGLLWFKNLQPFDSCNARDTELLVDVTVDNGVTRQFLTGLNTTTFYLKANKSHLIEFVPKKFELGAKDPKFNLRNLHTDLLYGAKVTVEVRRARSGELLPDQLPPFYVYRYVDAGDDQSDDVLHFLPTLADGPGGSSSVRRIQILGDAAIVNSQPFSVDTTAHFREPQVQSVTRPTWLFDPQEIGPNLHVPLSVKTPGLNRRVAGKLTLVGEGRDKYRVFLNEAALKKQLEELAVGSTPQDIILKMNPPGAQGAGTFRLKVKDRPPTPAFMLDAANVNQSDLQAALEELLQTNDFSVSVDTDTGSLPNEIRITVAFPNATADTPQPLLEVEASGSNLVSSSARPRARFGRITPSELELFRGRDARDELVEEVIRLIRVALESATNGIEITSDPQQANLELEWTTSDDVGLGEIVGDDIRKQTESLLDVVFDSGLYNLQSLAYRLSQPLTRQKFGRAVVNVDNILEDGGVVPYVLNRDQFSSALVSVAIHEAGHFFGLQHTSFLERVELDHEVQKLQVSNRGLPGDFFTLSFAGEPGTYHLFANSESDDVLAALLELETIAAAPNNVSVEGPRGGPWTVHFVRPGTPKAAHARFAGTDVPMIDVELTGEIVITPLPVKEGRSELRVLKGTNRQLGANNGRNDFMVGGGWPELTGERSFLPRFSETAIQGQTYDYSSDSLRFRDYVDLLRFSAAIPGDRFALSPDRESDVLERDFLTLDPGPRLAVFQSDTGVGPEAVEFGEVEADGSGGQTGMQQLTLLNFGSQNVVVRSVQVAQGYDQFSVVPLPVTTLAPGESLVVDVTFDPRFTGLSSGILQVDSNALGFSNQFDLQGIGLLPAPAPQLQVIFGNNNFGGLPVGEAKPLGEINFLRGYPFVPTVQNTGDWPLTVSEIRMAAGQGQNEYSVSRTLPVVLQPGEEFTFDPVFRPGGPGLRPGVIEIVSDDPQTPVFRQPVVGTGFVEDGSDLGHDFVAVESYFRETDNTPVLRTRSDAGGNWEFFLGPDALFHLATFDPASGLVAHGYARTNPSGQRTAFNIGAFEPSIDRDSDGDGLPDDIEFAIGTAADNTDSDGDGASDFAEINQGLNPLDDRPTVTGVIAALGVEGATFDVAVVADTQDANRRTAYLANSTGLVVADVTQFDRPVLLTELPLLGDGVDVAVDPQRSLAAVASGSGGLHLIDVSDPARPVLLQSVPVDVNQVVLYDGLAYAAAANEIQSFDTRSGEVVETLSLGDGEILGLHREGTMLFATNVFGEQGKIHAIDLSGVGMVLRGSLTLPRRGGKMFVAEGVAWIAVVTTVAADDGLMTVDVSQPDILSLLNDTDRNIRSVRDVALNGSGLGVFAGNLGGIVGTAIVAAAGDPTTTGPTFTQFRLPHLGEAVALSSGLAYIVTRGAGLQVVNFLAFDQGINPPDVTLGVLDTDLDPGRPGIQMLEASTVTLLAQITDDVQVRSVELLLNGDRARNEIAYPYDLSTTLPTIGQGDNQAVLQVRAIDTGGNVRLSDPVVIELLPDTAPPILVGLDPPDGSVQPVSRRTVTVNFSEPLAAATATAANFQLIGPGGVVAPLSLRLSQRGAAVQLLYPPLEEASYEFVVHAAAVTDRVGNALGAADMVSRFRVGFATREPTVVWVNPAGGMWEEPSNWLDVSSQVARVPIATDDVQIDVPGDATITLTSEREVRTLVSAEAFTIGMGGLLRTAETARVNNTFTLQGRHGCGSLNGDFAAMPTLEAFVLRGASGQGITVAGCGRLDGATIKTDLAIQGPGTRLHVAGGLTLQGDAMIDPAAVIAFEDSQTIDAGTFIFASSFVASGLIEAFQDDVVVTLGPAVVIRGGNGIIGNGSLGGSYVGELTLVNRGTFSVAGPDQFLQIRNTALQNQGAIEVKDRAVLSVGAATWSNSATGRISAADAQPNFLQLALGTSTTTSWSNAGVIDLNDTLAAFISGSGPNDVWSNTGTILSQDSQVVFRGQFTSADVQNVRRSKGLIRLDGTMDNVGRTFNFTTETGSYYLTGGKIVGGTLRMSGPDARLEFLGNSGGGLLDGVTIDGDIELGGVRDLLGNGALGYPTAQVRVANGLTLNGNVSVNTSANNIIFFEGNAQTVSGGAFRLIPDPLLGRNGGDHGLKAFQGGPVTLDASVSIQSIDSGVLIGRFISDAAITVEPDASLFISGTGIDPVYEFVNRGTVRVHTGAAISASVFTNEGTMIVDDALEFRLGRQGGTWHNRGVIDVTDSKVILDGVFTTADLGDYRNPTGQTSLQGMLDNSGSTLIIDGATGRWELDNSTDVTASLLSGGVVRILPGGSLTGLGGELKDVTVQGDFAALSLRLVGDITIDGAVNMRSGFNSLRLGDSHLFKTLPLTLRDGMFDFGGRQPKTIEGFAPFTGDVVSVTLGPDVELRGQNVVAPFPNPLLNQGKIIADFTPAFPGDDTNAFTFTKSFLTNEGLLEATGGGLLTVNNLVTNRGVIAARTGSVVSTAGDLPQDVAGTVAVDIAGPTSAEFGQVTVGGTAMLRGLLTVAFVNGYVPNVGDAFPILTYASHTGNFDSIAAQNLPANIALVPIYGAAGLTLTVTNALLAAATPDSSREDRGALPAPQALAALSHPAHARWMAAGLGNAEFGVADGSAITIAAGLSRFFDPTPRKDEEFSPTAVDRVFTALGVGPAAGQIDLRTSLMQDWGHIAGLDDLDQASAASDFMSEFLPAGVRRLP